MPLSIGGGAVGGVAHTLDGPAWVFGVLHLCAKRKGNKKVEAMRLQSVRPAKRHLMACVSTCSILRSPIIM